jgi:hypothetical protein
MFPHLGMDKIYNIFSNDQRYDVIIGSLPKCSCVYVVKLLVGSLGVRGVVCAL